MYARVDFPEPFGPIIACVSPELTVRFTPFKICLRPSFVSTDAYKSLISKVDMFISYSSAYFDSSVTCDSRDGAVACDSSVLAKRLSIAAIK